VTYFLFYFRNYLHKGFEKIKNKRLIIFFHFFFDN
jgi:hypothetical protein